MQHQGRVAVLAALTCMAAAAPHNAQTELKIFVLAGQSNMEGQAEVSTKNKTTGAYLNGTLAYQLSDPRTAKQFAPLWDSRTNNWTVLDDVKVWFNENGKEQGVNGSRIPSAPGEASFGSLTVGYGCGGDPNTIGPEYGFGFGMRDGIPDEKILIVKTAWGGKTLAIDYRPPSSASQHDQYCTAPACREVGHYYKVMVEDVHAMLGDGVISSMFPELKGLRPRVSGFGWFQGWNDGCDLNQTAAYEQNMVNLIKDLRKEWKNEHLAVSIPVAGFNGFNGAESTRLPPGDWIDMSPADKLATACSVDHGCRRLDIVLSQFAAANMTRHPELGGHVVASETRGFWREAQYSPNHGQIYHYWHNSETYYLVGRAMAKGMLQALGVQKAMYDRKASTTTEEEDKNHLLDLAQGDCGNSCEHHSDCTGTCSWCSARFDYCVEPEIVESSER